MVTIEKYIVWQIWNWIKVTFSDKKSVIFHKTEIAEVFEHFWGSFVSALWTALFKADWENTVKILTTFDNYVKKYILDYLYLKL